MKNYNYRVSYATKEEDVYTTVVTSTSRNPKVVLDDVLDTVYSKAVESGELKDGEYPIGLSILFVGETSDNVTQ